MKDRSKFGQIGGVAFPDNKDFIAEEAKFFEVLFVAGNVSLAFGVPESGVCGRCDPAKATAVDVPETAMNKDYLFVSDQNNIRVAGEVAAMEGVTITHSMNKRTNDYFRRSVLSKYARKMLAHKDLRTENVTLKMFEF